MTRQSSRIAKGIEKELKQVSAHYLMGGIAGVIIALLAAFLISPVMGNIQNPTLGAVLSFMLYAILIWVGFVVGTRRISTIFAGMVDTRMKLADRAERPQSPPPQGGKRAAPKILDTSVIIDGRVADILKTGFVEGKIVIPDFVLVELRHIADSSDALKRNRGRRGLDILNRIQEEFGIEILNTSNDKGLKEIPEVDVKLLKLAKNMKGAVVTNDFNLNKVAKIQGVGVLNINELANTLKPVVLPGEEMTLFLVKEGKEQGQAVAYLDDGTMIVVEDGKPEIGKETRVSVTSVLQTSAGRMIFARLKPHHARR
ncbi:MAG: PIN domain-containing protein [Clostridiales Family XIII bacterium]|nr:PIN domain-containing protein [Clostridiales Family XIII bacterium]